MLSHSSEANPDPAGHPVTEQLCVAKLAQGVNHTPQFRVVVFSSVLWFPFSELGWMSTACPPVRVWEGSTTGPELDAY